MSQPGRVELEESVVPRHQGDAHRLTVRRFAFSKYPLFDPAKMQRRERTKATKQKRRENTRRTTGAEGRFARKALLPIFRINFVICKGVTVL